MSQIVISSSVNGPTPFLTESTNLYDRVCFMGHRFLRNQQTLHELVRPCVFHGPKDRFLTESNKHCTNLYDRVCGHRFLRNQQTLHELVRPFVSMPHLFLRQNCTDLQDRLCDPCRIFSYGKTARICRTVCVHGHRFLTEIHCTESPKHIISVITPLQSMDPRPNVSSVLANCIIFAHNCE